MFVDSCLFQKVPVSISDTHYGVGTFPFGRPHDLSEIKIAKPYRWVYSDTLIVFLSTAVWPRCSHDPVIRPRSHDYSHGQTVLHASDQGSPS